MYVVKAKSTPEPIPVVQAPVVQAVFPAPKPVPNIIASKPRIVMASREEDQARPAVKKPVIKKAVVKQPVTKPPVTKAPVTQEVNVKGDWHSGKASWYGEDVGTRTASGERFHEDAMTCAHKTYKFGTKLEVAYGSKTVIVRVTDRGPFIRGRVLDLSKGSFAALCPLGSGVITVRYRVVK